MASAASKCFAAAVKSRRARATSPASVCTASDFGAASSSGVNSRAARGTVSP